MRARIYAARAAVVMATCCSLAACSSQTREPSNVLPATTPQGVRHVVSPRVSLGKFADPYGVAVDPRCPANCDVYVADPGARTVWVVRPDGSRSVVVDSTTLGLSFDPQSVAVSPIDGSVVVADKENFHTESIVWRIYNGSSSKITGFNDDWSDPIGREFVRGVAVGPRGEVYVALAQWGFLIDYGYGVQCVGACWSRHRFPTGTSYGVAADGSGVVYVAATRFKAVVRRVPPGDTYHDFLKIGDPYDVAVSWTGGHVVVADPANKRVWYARPDGSLIDIGSFVDPYGVAVDREGHVYVADAGAKEVFKIKL